MNGSEIEVGVTYEGRNGVNGRLRRRVVAITAGPYADVEYEPVDHGGRARGVEVECLLSTFAC